MRQALITARKHGQTTFTVVSGPEVGVSEQREKFKDFARLDHHKEIAEVQLWESDTGITKKIKKPAQPKPDLVAEAKAAEEAKAKADAEAKAKTEASEKPKKK